MDDDWAVRAYLALPPDAAQQVLAIEDGAWATIAGYLWVRPPGSLSMIPVTPGRTWPTPTGPTISELILCWDWHGWLRAGQWIRAEN